MEGHVPLHGAGMCLTFGRMCPCAHLIIALTYLCCRSHLQEATGINAEKNFKFDKIVNDPTDACFGATDVFSFGVMLYIMFTRSPKWFKDEGRPPLPTTKGDDGKPAEDMQQVAKWYFNGERPVFDDLQASDRLFDSFPPLLRLLIEGCWAGKQADRLRFKEIESLLTDASIGWLDMPEAKPVVSFDDWLATNGMEDKKEGLHEYDVREGKDPLGKLVEMMQDEEEDFKDMIEDVLEDDDGAQASFRAAVSELVCASTAGASGDSAVADDGAARLRLVSMLPKSSTEELLATKDEQVATLKEEMAAQVATLKEEMAVLRAQLERLEGVPPQ